MKYKNYIFDCGNVLFSFSKDFLLETYVKDPKDRPILADVIFKHWEKQDEGMESNEFYEFIKAQLPERLHEAANNITFNWDLWIRPFEDIRELLLKLKETGHKLYLLSNMPSTFSKDHSKLPILDIFDGLLFSYDAKIVKPNPKIFEICVENFKLNKENCIFIDDAEINCEASKNIGIESYLFDKNKREDFIKFVTEIENL